MRRARPERAMRPQERPGLGHILSRQPAVRDERLEPRLRIPFRGLVSQATGASHVGRVVTCYAIESGIGSKRVEASGTPCEVDEVQDSRTRVAFLPVQSLPWRSLRLR